MSSRVTRPGLRRRIRRAVFGHRRAVAALLVAVAVVAALQALRAPNPPDGPGRDRAAAIELPSLGEQLVAAHPGLGVVPIRLADAAMAGLLEAGDRITLMATETGGGGGSGAGRVVATDVRVLHSVPQSGDDRVMTSAAGRLIIVGVPTASVPSVTAASVRSVLTYAWDR